MSLPTTALSETELGKGGMSFMSSDQRLLWQEAWELLRAEKAKATQPYADYGFILFPAAKVYEGFLKTFFYQLGVISRRAYYDEHFRIGKSLNPDLPKEFRDGEWVYDDLTVVCGQATAQALWEAWRRGRNQVFHYSSPGGQGNLTLAEAEVRLVMLKEAMEAAVKCEVRVKRE